MRRHVDPTVFRVVFVTDGRGDAARIESLVEAAVAGGVRAVQVREPTMTAPALVELAQRLRPVLRAANGLLFVNDHLDGAALGPFDGVQLGRRSVAWERARSLVGESRLLSCSVHDERELARAVVCDADLALLSPVWPTRSKPMGSALGVAAAAERTGATPLPLVWLGGVDAEAVASVACVPSGQRPIGFAAISAIAASSDVRAGAARLVEAAVHVLGAARD